MDLQLTRRGDYVVGAAIALARAGYGGPYRKLREISAEMSIPERYTHEIVSLLVKAGMAEAMAGKLGGYRLVRDPADISLLEVVEAAEGNVRLDRCTMSGGPCYWQGKACAVHPALEESVRAFTTSLRQRSLAQVLEVDNRLQAEQGADVR